MYSFDSLPQVVADLSTEVKNLQKLITNFQSPPPAEQEINLSIKQLAAYLGISIATVHNYKRRGVFPFFQTGRTVFFKKSEIDAALAVGKKRNGGKSL